MTLKYRDIDEAEYLLDQLGAPDKDEDKLVTKLRSRLSLFLKEIREGAEGMIFNSSLMRVMFLRCKIGSGKKD